MGWDWVDAIHPDDRERATKALRDAVASGEGFQTELRKRSADGSYCWFLERALPVRDAAGRVIRWLGTCTDIDDQKRSQERLEFWPKLAILSSSCLRGDSGRRDAAGRARHLDWCTVHVLNDGPSPSGRRERRPGAVPPGAGVGGGGAASAGQPLWVCLCHEDR
jgi:hypothetical protein